VGIKARIELDIFPSSRFLQFGRIAFQDMDVTKETTQHHEAFLIRTMTEKYITLEQQLFLPSLGEG
jgi:hypothetical protein